MKRKLLPLLCAGAVMLAMLQTALAANRVPRLTVDVALRSDGSAHVTQVFSAMTEAGTEFYLDQLDSGVLSFTDFTVSDEKGPYEVLERDAWDIHASLEEKAGKCGMLSIDGGVELCWGIGSYGEHAYTVEYNLHGLAGAYSDADGIHYRFVNGDMSFFPTDAAVTIRMEDGTPLTDGNCGIWAFGFDGQIQFQDDGSIRAWTQSPLEGQENMTLMVSFQKGVLAPARQESGSFEDVKQRAFEGSDYEPEEEISTLSVVLTFLGLAAAVICGIQIIRALSARKRKKMTARTNYFRDVPNGGDLNASFVLGSSLGFCPEDSLIGARLLRLIALGSLEPSDTARDGADVSLIPVRPPHNGDAYDEALYTFLETAAGADGVLQPAELEQFCWDTSHGEALARFLDECERNGKRSLIHKGCFKGAVCEKTKDLTAAGRKELDELLGLKHYLMDFSLLSERNVNETFLWQDYMVYAMLLGIAKEVMAQLRKQFPGNLPQLQQYTRYVNWAYSYHPVLYGAAERERSRMRAEREARFSGSGGHSSLGGGGGFLGGGSGGTR